jgi:cytochrome b pre-mRNA-processing protein 3
MVLARLFRRKPFEREGYELYGAAVAAAREPVYYLDYAVPDTLQGRFDLVGLHVALLIRRLRHDAAPAGKDLAQAVFDAMFNDMDKSLREMGVGDMSISKRVKRMWEAFHGRAQAYEAALDAGDAQGLADALLRNLWAGSPPEDTTAAPRLAARAMVIEAALAAQPMEALNAGRLAFPAP